MGCSVRLGRSCCLWPCSRDGIKVRRGDIDWDVRRVDLDPFRDMVAGLSDCLEGFIHRGAVDRRDSASQEVKELGASRSPLSTQQMSQVFSVLPSPSLGSDPHRRLMALVFSLLLVALMSSSEMSADLCGFLNVSRHRQPILSEVTGTERQRVPLLAVEMAAYGETSKLRHSLG